MTASLESMTRPELFRQLERSLADAKREDCGLALMLLGIHKPRNINIKPNYGVDDEVLREQFQRIRKVMRRSDVVLRVGDTEFALILSSLVSSTQAVLAAKRLHDACTQPFECGGSQIKAHVRIGLALYPDHGADPGALLRCADIAISRARNMESGFAVYSEGAA